MLKAAQRRIDFLRQAQDGAAACEADKLLGPRLVVLSASQGEASSIRFPGTTEAGREGKSGCGVSVSCDGVSAGLEPVLPHRDVCPLIGDRWGFPESSAACLKCPLASWVGTPRVRQAGEASGGDGLLWARQEECAGHPLPERPGVSEPRPALGRHLPTASLLGSRTEWSRVLGIETVAGSWFSYVPSQAHLLLPPSSKHHAEHLNSFHRRRAWAPERVSVPHIPPQTSAEPRLSSECRVLTRGLLPDSRCSWALSGGCRLFGSSQPTPFIHQPAAHRGCDRCCKRSDVTNSRDLPGDKQASMWL